ncbi:MAG: hypothetical protein Ct9H90mP2_00090 [Dehalococcoidia bacterium]|nr:MAG: hypothetical protein Ct9H90mP2_00090 [Dehalococcoidia bacterium]
MDPHVSLGILWLGFLLYNEFNGNLTSDNAVDLEIAGLYWHFVDIVWIIIFGLLYLITAGDGVPRWNTMGSCTLDRSNKIVFF